MEQTGVWVTPVAGSQASSVQGFPSSMLTGVWVTPEVGSQASMVQAFPSSEFTGAWVTPVAGSQESTVHASPSLALMAVFEQLPARQASIVQRLLSLQSASLVHSGAPPAPPPPEEPVVAPPAPVLSPTPP
jgi:hypothetical protein